MCLKELPDFEDADIGIISARAIGTKVIAVSIIQPKGELAGADVIVNDYNFKILY